MNADQLLQGFDLLGDTPKTIQQFRKLVVSLAISGRLDPKGSDDMTSALAEAARSQGLLSKTEGQKKAVFSAAILEDLPVGFSKPNSFVRLGEVARIEKGLTGIIKTLPGPFSLVVTGPDRMPCDHYDFDGNAAIVPLVSSAGHGKASLHRLHYQEGKFALGSILAAIFPHKPELISARFIYEYLTAFKDELLVSRMIGTANVSLSIRKVSEVPIPLVAPAIQRKVDKLMALCDRLEAARAEREDRRDQLASSSLARLSKRQTANFRDDARFALDAISSLAARPDQIKQLRHTILNLAMRGKLVLQDQKDEPVSELLKRIAKEIANFSQANRIAQTHGEPITSDKLPFEAPIGWQWVRLCALFKVITDGDHQPPPKTDEGVAFLTIGNVTTGELNFANCRLVAKTYFQSLAPYRTPANGDILYTVVGATYGRPAVVETDREFCVQRHIAILKPAATLNSRFLVWLLSSPLVYDQASRSTTGSAQPTVALRPLRNFAVPLPPVAEQDRIVAKIDELMALCDQLEAALTAGEKSRFGLLTALLGEALRPGEERDEAA